MPDLHRVLDGAASKGLIDRSKLQAVEAYLRAAMPELGRHATIGAADDDGVVFETETPRFIRGFHDVLITIGAAILLVGIGGLGAVIGLLPVIILLAEILVRRQRLALPAVLLSVAMGVWSAFICHMLADWMDFASDSHLRLALTFGPFPLLMLGFYGRYRIPVALAAVIFSAFAILFVIGVGLIETLLGSANLVVDHPRLAVGLGVAAALGLFAVAMGYDLSDPARLSRRSDIAFWLHLAAAPALLYAGIAVLFLIYFGDLKDIEDGIRGGVTLQVILVILVLMLIGVVIDRRAFVTSGLLSLIITVTSILRQSEMEMDNVLFLALITVGAVVLTIGIGWQPLRRVVVGSLPAELKTKLPPLH